MTLEWEQVIVDAADPGALAGGGLRRWSGSWLTTTRRSSKIRPAPEQVPGLLFAPVSEPKTRKNRLHLDFRPTTGTPPWLASWSSAPLTRMSARASKRGPS